MVFLSTARSGLITDFPQHTVEIIDRINNPALAWAPLEDPAEDRRLWCNDLHERHNGISTATLVLELGHVFQPGGTVFLEYQPEDLSGKYCRITFTDDGLTKVWVGYIVGTPQDRSAVKTNVDPNQNKLTGRRQEFEAVGLEYFLGRTQVDTAVVREGLGTHIRTNRPLVFNGDRSVSHDNDTSRRGNRFSLPQFDESGNPESDGAAEDFAFTNGASVGVPWSAKDQVRHILRYHQPTDKDDEPAPCKFRLQFRRGTQGMEIPNDQAMLEGFYPTISSERKTPLDLLNEIILPSRGLCWWPELSKDGFGNPITTPGFIEVRIRVASRATSAIEFPGGGSLPANVDQVELNFDNQLDVSDAVIREDRRRNYHQIVYRGARMTVTCTFATSLGTLEPDWTSDFEDKYKAGGGAATAKEKDTYRRSDIFTSIYSYFRVPYNWNGEVDPLGFHFPAIASIAPDGTVSASVAPFSIWGLRLLNTTRLLVGYDYLADTENPTPFEEIPTGSMPDMLKPFAFFSYTPQGEESIVVRYSDKLRGHTGPVGKLTCSFNLAMQQNGIGIVLRENSGRQHIVAGENWTGAGTETTEYTPELGWQFNGDYVFSFGATVCLETDIYAEGKWPETLANVPDGVPVEPLTIYAGDKYRLDYLAPQTLLYVDDDELDVLHPTGGVIRNDQQQLQDLARMAYEWYKVDRQPISFKFQHCKPLFRLGMLVTTIGEGSTLVNVNSVVSSIHYNLREGVSTIGTDEADINFA